MQPHSLKKQWVYTRRGFTLIELLVVVAILGILMTTTLIAINPIRQIKQAKDTRRKSDVIALLNAVQQYTTDHGGSLPIVVPATATEISKVGVDLCAALAPTYVAGLPIDPVLGGGIVRASECTTSYATGYTISKNPTENQVTIAAPNAESGDPISFTR
ncbi:MAG: type II secretion system protein [bacterium]|nr:type II secretion system protein [bacterium]